MAADLYRIVEATAADIPALVEFGRAQFIYTFGPLYSPQDLEHFLTEEYVPEVYEQFIADEAYTIFMAMGKDDKIKGHVITGRCGLALENCGFDASYKETCREIKRMYVIPETFGTGLADLLLTTGLKFLKEQGFGDRTFLGVYTENHRAINFYKRHKFKQIGEHGFVVGDHVDRDYICHWQPDAE